MQGLDSLFGSLLGGKTSPFMSTFYLRRLGLLQVSLCLGEPVFRTIRHNSLSLFRFSGFLVEIYHDYSKFQVLIQIKQTVDTLYDNVL